MLTHMSIYIQVTLLLLFQTRELSYWSFSVMRHPTAVCFGVVCLFPPGVTWPPSGNRVCDGVCPPVKARKSAELCMSVHFVIGLLTLVRRDGHRSHSVSSITTSYLHLHAIFGDSIGYGRRKMNCRLKSVLHDATCMMSSMKAVFELHMLLEALTHVSEINPINSLAH